MGMQHYKEHIWKVSFQIEIYFSSLAQTGCDWIEFLVPVSAVVPPVSAIERVTSLDSP
jgi:hypothetical protein